MGQYWKIVSLSKKEFIDPYKLGCGAKLWEQLANHPGTPAALFILCAAMPEPRGGGDFDMNDNWHGPERTSEYNISPGPMPDSYPEIARRTIGRWAGDRIAVVGDYAEDSDLEPEDDANQIYSKCGERDDSAIQVEEYYTDITDDVAKVIEHELNGKYTGTGWKEWKENK